MGNIRSILTLTVAVAVSSCSPLMERAGHPATGTPATAGAPSTEKLRSIMRVPRQSADDGRDFVVVTISGGGMRAAVYGAQMLFELKEVMPKISMISSVSGGSITAALYGLSCDAGDCPPFTSKTDRTHRCPWKEKDDDDPACPGVFTQLGYDLQGFWLLNWMQPEHILAYWFRDLTRADIMARELDKVYFHDLKLADLNPHRPMIMINTSKFTHARPSIGKEADTLFSFTAEDFETIKSDVSQYPLNYAVMASSAFPGLLQHVVIRDYSSNPVFADDKGPFLHLVDGGTTDNLGLLAVEEVLESMKKEDIFRKGVDRILIIEIDASTGRVGPLPYNKDPRKYYDYVFDANAINESFDSLMNSGYARTEKSVDNLGEGLVGKSNYARLPLHLRSLATPTACIKGVPVAGDGALIEGAGYKEKEWCGIKDVPTLYSITSERMEIIRRAATKIFADERDTPCKLNPHHIICK